MLHAADVEAIQELKKKAEEEAAKRRQLESQVTKASSVLQDKVAAWNVVERQLKVGRLQLEIGRRCPTVCSSAISLIAIVLTEEANICFWSPLPMRLCEL